MNGLEQNAGQAGRGGDCRCAGGGTQAIGQDADNEQTAVALSAATQDGASNTNTPVRVGSWGHDGDVSQSNSVSSKATAFNANLTGQGAEQGQSGASGCCAAGGIQAIGQDAKSEQSAGAASAATQSGGRDKCGCPSGGNVNTPVRVDSKGGGGSVTQENAVDSSATAGNMNLTVQEAGQAEAGGGPMYSSSPVYSDGQCGCSGGGKQAIGQEAKSEQDATALSAALQHGAKNENTPVRVGSYGGGGSVEQSNTVGSSATAANLNGLQQGAAQAGGGGIQAIGQEAKNEQGALAASLAAQEGASNANAPVRVDSKGYDGHVSQSNSVDSDAIAGNTNLTIQDAGQESWGGRECGCHGGIGIQAIGQEAKNEQGAAALSAALQHGASNENAPVRVGSYGGGGSVEQSNSVGSSATAANLNGLHQKADQDGSAGGGIDDPGDRSVREEPPGRTRPVRRVAARRVEQLEPRRGRQQGRQRRRLAVERRRFVGDRRKHQPDQAGRRPGAVGPQGLRLRRDRDPGDRSGVEEPSGRACRVAGHSGLRTREVRLLVERQLERPCGGRRATAPAARWLSRTPFARRRQRRT